MTSPDRNVKIVSSYKNKTKHGKAQNLREKDRLCVSEKINMAHGLDRVVENGEMWVVRMEGPPDIQGVFPFKARALLPSFIQEYACSSHKGAVKVEFPFW